MYSFHRTIVIEVQQIKNIETLTENINVLFKIESLQIPDIQNICYNEEGSFVQTTFGHKTSGRFYRKVKDLHRIGFGWMIFMYIDVVIHDVKSRKLKKVCLGVRGRIGFANIFTSPTRDFELDKYNGCILCYIKIYW